MINIYCVYKIDLIASTRDDTFTQFKMLYLVLQKLLKMLILQNIIIKGMVFVLMKAELLVKEKLTTDETY